MSFIANGLVKFEEYEIDRSRWQLSWGDKPLPLNRKTFDLLLYLVDHADRVVGKDELLRRLWPESFVEESNLTQHIFLLRKALSRHESGTKIIETIPGRGYRFAAVIKEQQPATDRMVISASESITRITLEEEVDTSEPASHELEVTQPLLSTPSGKRRIHWIVGGLIVGVALCVAGWFGWQRWLDRSGGAPVQVVLTPIEGTTGDAILDKSLTQALRMDLAQSPYITVVPASSVLATLTQMMHKPDDTITPAMAREVCERTNSQAVLSGSLARIGQHYLVTEEASNCVDGSVIGQSKYEVETAEELPRAIDKLAATLRRNLGESRRSIARFNMPLFAQNTSSLDALKAWTQGVEADRRGDTVRAIAFYKLAVAADPNFAWAYYSLATTSSNAGDYAASREASAKAYSLRDTAGKPQAFAINALYNVLVTQDLYESLRNYQTWAGLYPNSSLAWNGLAYVQANLGRYTDAAVSDGRSVALAPQNQNYLNTLALSLIQSGESDEARKTLDQAVAMKIDDNYIRVRYLELAYLLHDESLLRAQRQWSDAHPRSAIVLVTEVEIAIAEGRFADARRLLARSNQLYREQGVEGAADQYTKATAVEMMEAGDGSEAKSLFSRTPADLEEGEEVLGLAYSGNISAAQSAIRAMQTKYPKGTLWHLYWGPLTQAVIALRENKAKEAAAVLETARPVENRELVVPWLRGNAYLASGQPTLAEADYRNVVTHPERDPTSPSISLSWLGLGRAFAAQGKRSAAIDAYQHFFTLWAHADPDAMYLRQAKQEFATLQTIALAK
ncbi:tetratricopeptide repeat protein [Granulicella sp. WH15]|uniref:winged helix-turn-helix domain-containing protein n=1 Tax=Granulicella sp. WH15 TaxID=2602070 RepID=UPI001366E678|nr:winged helix-turn-helix domain-containing protein [Granulicella sp. WH15]QHN03512.1 tetratricopeptide repeat protein [Granulicella sp. WH15]